MIGKVIVELNENLKKTIHGYKSMSLCDIESAQTLYTDTVDPSYNIDLISACNLEIIKAKLKTLDAMEIEDDIDIIVIHLKKEVHFIKITESKDYFIYLAIDGEDVKIDLIKQFLDVYTEKLNEVINEVLVY